MKTTSPKLEKKDRFLLISAKPAPNGELHLGHLSGPFLNQDIFYRHLASKGADVQVMSGTDPIDSFIPLLAHNNKDSSRRVADKNFLRIEKNFRDYGFHYDFFANPLSPEWREKFIGANDSVIQTATSQGLTHNTSKPFPYDSDTDSAASGSWLIGDCPDCNETLSGYFCEDCGAHIEPSEVKNGRHRLSANALTFKNTTDTFFHINNPDLLLTNLKQARVRDTEYAIVEKQMENSRFDVRLTENASWGIPYRDKPGKVYFGHGLLYAYCRFIGNVYKEKNGLDDNAFDESSDVTTINFFGIDNTSSHMVNIQAIGELTEGWKGFSHFVVNDFFLLEGKKFSTSAQHLISASEILEKSSISADGVRFVLASMSPTKKRTSLEKESFVQHHNTHFIAGIVSLCKAKTRSMNGQLLSIEKDKGEFLKRWENYCQLFDVKTFTPTELIDYISTHCDVISKSDSEESIAFGLAELALISYPICPLFASELWLALGLTDEPNVEALLSINTLTITALETPLSALSNDEISQLFSRGNHAK